MMSPITRQATNRICTHLSSNFVQLHQAEIIRKTFPSSISKKKGKVVPSSFFLDRGVWTLPCAPCSRYSGLIKHEEKVWVSNLAFQGVSTAGKLQEQGSWSCPLIHLYLCQHTQNILMIGGGVSSIDIANDISPFANTIYQSTRNGKFDLVESMLPKNGVRVNEISHFEIQSHSDEPLSDDEPLPLTIHFESGQSLHGIHMIMLCTGYHITFPYLEERHSDETTLQDADESILTTDGTQVHNLYQDIFYMPDTTLVFIGLPYYTFTFSIFDFQAIVVAQVLSGTVQLPTKTEMRSEYNAKVERVGLGKMFHSILGTDENYVHALLTWVNTSRAAQELVAIQGFSPRWYEAKEALRQKYRAQVKK